jgi:hypothetical protein
MCLNTQEYWRKSFSKCPKITKTGIFAFFAFFAGFKNLPKYKLMSTNPKNRKNSKMGYLCDCQKLSKF